MSDEKTSIEIDKPTDMEEAPKITQEVVALEEPPEALTLSENPKIAEEAMVVPEDPKIDERTEEEPIKVTIQNDMVKDTTVKDKVEKGKAGHFKGVCLYKSVFKGVHVGIKAFSKDIHSKTVCNTNLKI